MNLMCKLGLHKPVASRVWNDGHYFSACQRCGRSLIRKTDGRWTLVPSHLKVVWRKRTEEDVVWPTHLL